MAIEIELSMDQELSPADVEAPALVVDVTVPMDQRFPPYTNFPYTPTEPTPSDIDGGNASTVVFTTTVDGGSAASVADETIDGGDAHGD